MGIDFSECARINEIIATHESFVLYPSKHAINLSHHNPRGENVLEVKKPMAIFLIDSTWACSLKMMRENPEKEQLLVVNLSGRGDKDIFTVHDILKARGEI